MQHFLKIIINLAPQPQDTSAARSESQRCSSVEELSVLRAALVAVPGNMLVLLLVV